jgi:hypothetical protein
VSLDPLVIARLDGGRLVLHAEGLASHFFAVDPSSVGVGAYDSLAGRTSPERIELRDVVALNTTMRARTPHVAWEPLLDRRLEWLEAIPTDLDLITASPDEWSRLRGDALVEAGLSACVGRGRGVSVATKMLHLKRPRLFPVLDSFVAQMLGGTIADDAPVAVRAARATELTTHVRDEGRRNLVVLLELQRRLEHERFARSLVRILDAALWLSHPAAGSGLGRLIEVKRV